MIWCWLNAEHMKAWLIANGKTASAVRTELEQNGDDGSMIYRYLNGNIKKVQEKTAHKLQSIFGDEVIKGTWQGSRRLPPTRTAYFIDVEYLRAWLVKHKKSPCFIEQYYQISYSALYRYLRGEIKTVRPSKVAKLQKVFGEGIVKAVSVERKGVQYA